MTTPRENLFKVFRHEEPDWVPIVGAADGYNSPSGMPSSFYDIVGRSRALELCQYFDVDVMDRPGGLIETRYRNVEHTASTEDGLRTECWGTPHGVITRRSGRREWPSPHKGEPNLVSWAPCEWPIKSVDDYKAFAHIVENQEYVIHAEVAAQSKRNVGDSGMVTPGAPASPLGNCVGLYMGVEHLAYACVDHPTELRDLLAVIAEKYYECYRGLAETEIDAAFAMDNTSTQAISPRMFRELELPFLNTAADIMESAGKLFVNHACGKIRDLLGDLAGSRIHGLHGPAMPPVGNTTVADARAKLGSIVIMPYGMTSLDADTVDKGDPDTIRHHIRGIFEEAGHRRNLIVWIAPPAAVPVATMWLAVDEAKKLSRGLGEIG